MFKSRKQIPTVTQEWRITIQLDRAWEGELGEGWTWSAASVHGRLSSVIATGFASTEELAWGFAERAIEREVRYRDSVRVYDYIPKGS